ncbi:hypothetical protein [Prosthecobacter sp.]|uniref:hypothetical protein n=1 Tax=Prosthecobacter sp. TaxID=1965333 RepID=UPI0037840A55
MKAIVISCLWFMGCSFVLALLLHLTLSGDFPAPDKKGGYTHLLSHSLVFEAGGNGSEPRFVATLTNSSTTKLKIIVNDKDFHATLRVKNRSGQEDEIFEKEYLNLLTTTMWSEPQIEMAPNQSITWVVPLSSLSTLHGNDVAHESLMGCTVVSDMHATVVPPRREYVGDNARQESKPILIPDKD